MRKIFLDTNIILDFLIRPEYQEDMREFLKSSAKEDLCISFLLVANAAYIMRKYPKSEIIQKINLLLQIFKVIPNTEDQIKAAVKIESPDFEDMLQYQTALSGKCDLILTRNSKDFPYSKIPVMSVREYLMAYQCS